MWGPFQCQTVEDIQTRFLLRRRGIIVVVVVARLLSVVLVIASTARPIRTLILWISNPRESHINSLEQISAINIAIVIQVQIRHEHGLPAEFQ